MQLTLEHTLKIMRELKEANDEIERLWRTSEYWKAEHLAGNDEITRLTAEVENQVQWVNELADNLIAEEAKTATLRAEVERLRAALEKIEYLDRPQVRGQLHRVSIQEIAAAALTEEKP
jgi:septal ring factor EnvC (AmiA/AmiB activator)